MSSTIESLGIDMKLIQDDSGTLPTLNLHDAQFKISLKHFTVVRSIMKTKVT